MSKDTYKKLQKARLRFHDFRTKLIVRVWNLAKRLEPKTMKEEKSKKKQNNK